MEFNFLELEVFRNHIGHNICIHSRSLTPFPNIQLLLPACLKKFHQNRAYYAECLEGALTLGIYNDVKQKYFSFVTTYPLNAGLEIFSLE